LRRQENFIIYPTCRPQLLWLSDTW